MISTQFDPTKHGFHFQNGTFSFHVAITKWSILCGGIAYSELDYYFHKLKPPESSVAPAEYNPLQSYLYRRQMRAHLHTWYKFVDTWAAGEIPILGPIFWAMRSQGEVPGLSRWLQANDPVVLFLYNRGGGAHHVLAIGSDPARPALQLCDSNHPDQTAWLIKNGDYWYHSLSHHNWSGWFPDWGYYNDGVQVPPFAWRICIQCFSLYTTTLWSNGKCPASGGAHAEWPGSEYFLPLDLQDGQRRWRCCFKCHGLYCDADPLLPKTCPAGGTHLPTNLGTTELEFSVHYGGGQGTPNFFECGKCAGMFFKSPTCSGRCPAGDTHTPNGESQNYVLDGRTV
jgi:hypothetical protein